MTLVGWESSRSNAKITIRLGVWAEADGTGEVSDSSGGFRLPNGAVRAPGAAWVLKSRIAPIPAAQRQRFIPLCPDFVLERRSPSDRLEDLQAKMVEYVANGARLGWLLDPEARQVYIYRPNVAVERLDNPDALSGDPVLPGFTLNLREVW